MRVPVLAHSHAQYVRQSQADIVQAVASASRPDKHLNRANSLTCYFLWQTMKALSPFLMQRQKPSSSLHTRVSCRQRPELIKPATMGDASKLELICIHRFSCKIHPYRFVWPNKHFLTKIQWHLVTWVIVEM